MAAALHLARYLKGTINVGPFYPSNNSLDLYTYMDADWGNCVFCRKSLTGYCAFLGKSLTSWKTKKQKTTSKSSAESEHKAMSDMTSELVWLANFLRDFQVTPSYPITLFCDNKAAQYIATNPVFHTWTMIITMFATSFKKDFFRRLTSALRISLQICSLSLYHHINIISSVPS